MKAAVFEYRRARSVEEAAALLAEGGGNTRLLAGGQSLGPMLNLRLARPARLVDIKRAEGLRDVAADDALFSIGAAFTHAEIEDGTIEDPTGGLLRRIASGIAYRAIRNRGTLGGSLAHADPAAEWVSAMAALGAVIVAYGAGGRLRRLPADRFLRGAFATALAEDEVLTAVEVPRPSRQARFGYYKLCRKVGEFAKAIGIAVLDPDRGIARVLAGAVDGAPVLLPITAARLRDAGPHAAARTVADEIDLQPSPSPCGRGPGGGGRGAGRILLPHLTAAERALRATAVCRAIMQLDTARAS
jgi:aerobic carbon-monoxide dehydrogenase medium subunit